MRPLLRTLTIALLAGVPLTSAAQTGPGTLTTRDLVALAQAGLGDEVLVAMIDADASVFRLGPMDVLELRKQGLSDAVLVRMIRTVPAAPLPPPVPAPALDRVAESEPDRAPAPRVRDADRRAVVEAPPPVVVTQTVVQQVHVEPQREYVPVYVPIVTRPREPEKPREPEYWGFGGQRRPDAWQEPKKPEPPKRPGGGH